MKKHTQSNAILTICLMGYLSFFSACNTEKRTLRYGGFYLFGKSGNKYTNLLMPEPGNFVIKNDGSKVEFDHIENPILKNIFSKIKPISFVLKNGETLTIGDVKAYQYGNIYYGSINSGKNRTYLKRVKKGKLNVFEDITSTASTTFSNGTLSNNSHTIINYYGNIEGSNNMENISNIKGLKNVLKGCPKAIAMVDMKYHELNKKLNEDRAYLNKVVDLFNNNCQKNNK